MCFYLNSFVTIVTISGVRQAKNALHPLLAATNTSRIFIAPIVTHTHSFFFLVVFFYFTNLFSGSCTNDNSNERRVFVTAAMQGLLFFFIGSTNGLFCFLKKREKKKEIAPHQIAYSPFFVCFSVYVCPAGLMCTEEDRAKLVNRGSCPFSPKLLKVFTQPASSRFGCCIIPIHTHKHTHPQRWIAWAVETFRAGRRFLSFMIDTKEGKRTFFSFSVSHSLPHVER